VIPANWIGLKENDKRAMRRLAMNIAAKFGLGEFDEILPDDGDTMNWEEYDDTDPIAQARMALLTYLDDKAAGEAILPYNFNISVFLDQVSIVFH
jgi:hypothetical protein